MPPVLFRLLVSAPRLAAAGLACAAKVWSRPVIGSSARDAVVPGPAAWPRVWTAGIAAWEKGPSVWKKRLMLGAYAPRSSNTGAAWSAKLPSLRLVVCSSRRKGGKSWKLRSSASPCEAVASATVLTCVN